MARIGDNRASNASLRGLGLCALLLVLAACGGSNPAAPPVVIPPLDSIRISPDTLEIRVGSTGAFVAVGYDTAGQTISSVPASWSTSDSTHSIVTIDATGHARGLSEGTAWVYAVADSQVDSAVVVVGPFHDGWYTQTTPTTVALHGVFFLPDGRTGWAVGDLGQILVTHDAGSHWATQHTPTTLPLESVWFTNASNGWAVGDDGMALHTVNGGSTWTRVIVGVTDDLEDLCFANDSTGWIAATGGTLLNTRDGGRTWTRKSPAPFSLRGISFADTLDGWAVGDGGVIVGTHDGGEIWFIVQPYVTSAALNAVWRRSQTLAWAVGAGGDAPRTVHPDSTRWELRSAGTLNPLEGVHFPSDLVGFAVGSAGTVRMSNNGGLSWTSQISGTTYNLDDVFFVDEQRGWAVGGGGTIVHTGTGGVDSSP